MARGLCFICDKPYSKGHNCGFKEPHLFTIEVYGEEENDEVETEECNNAEKKWEDACISLQALTGDRSHNTMRVVGMYERKPLHILVDSGSTHNFLDIRYAKSLGCKLEQIHPLEVNVADGVTSVFFKKIITINK